MLVSKKIFNKIYLTNNSLPKENTKIQNDN